jgi:hypothetical protein
MKTIFTPREELVCGKLDVLQTELQKLGAVDLIYLVDDIRHDCERMEKKLVFRKMEADKVETVDLLTKAKKGNDEKI